MERGAGGEGAAVRVFSVWRRAACLHWRGVCDDGGDAAAGGDCAAVPDAVGDEETSGGVGEHYTAAERRGVGGVGGTAERVNSETVPSWGAAVLRPYEAACAAAGLAA